MSEKNFETELEELLKKHNIPSLRMLCYNDPDLVNQIEAVDEDDYNERFEEWVKDNPEPEYPSWKDYVGGYANPKYTKDVKAWDKKYRAWVKKRDEALGLNPEDLKCNLFREEYDESYTPGLWYSSRC